MSERVWLTTAEARRRFEAAARNVIRANVGRNTNPSRWLEVMPNLIDQLGEAMAEYCDTREHWRTPAHQR